MVVVIELLAAILAARAERRVLQLPVIPVASARHPCQPSAEQAQKGAERHALRAIQLSDSTGPAAPRHHVDHGLKPITTNCRPGQYCFWLPR
jgi:hypothetical protein